QRGQLHACARTRQKHAAITRRLSQARVLYSISLFVIFLLSSCAPQRVDNKKVRVTTWNLEWFPNGSPKELSVDAQNARISAAAVVLRQLDPDILLLQEMKDYDACARLAKAIRPGRYQIAICSAFRQGGAIAKQQQAILAKIPAQAAWSEFWKSTEGIDP